MRLATSSCNPACQERRSITHALLRAAVPMRFVTAGCKPAEQERHPKSTKVCASLALQWGPDHTNPGLLQTQLFLTLCVKSISRYRPVHFLPAAFPEQRPYFGNPQERTTRKKRHRVSRTRAFSSVNSHVPDLSHFNYLMMVG